MGLIAILFLTAAAWLYYALPRRVRTVSGKILGFCLGLFKLRREVIIRNLELAFPGEDEALRERRIGQAYEHLGHLVLEILLLFGPLRRFVLRECTLIGADHWREAQSRGKGVLFLSSHVGNWEVMAATGAIHGGMDLMLVTKHLKPEWLHRAVERARLRCGVRATYEPKTLKDVLRSLDRGGTVGFVLDQYAGAPVGVRVPVFNVPVGTMTAVATLAKRTGALVLPVVNYRDPRGLHRVEIRPALAWLPHENPDHEIAQNTALYARELEKDIYAHPEQWLWIHRRFKGDLSPLRPGEWDQGRARK